MVGRNERPVARRRTPCSVGFGEPTIAKLGENVEVTARRASSEAALPRKAFNANAVLHRMGVGRNYLYAFGAY